MEKPVRSFLEIIDLIQHVTIRIAGHLDQTWAEWLDDFTISHTELDETVLTGSVEDQAALYGVMAKLRDLGVKLISVNFGEQVPPGK